MLNDWKPFKVIPASQHLNGTGDWYEKHFYVVLQVPGFQTIEQFEGNLEECEKECNELNQRISTSLSLHIQNQK
jgi:hypothetical protein